MGRRPDRHLPTGPTGASLPRSSCSATSPLDDVPAWASRGFVATETARFVEVAPGMTASPSPFLADLVGDWREPIDRLVDAAPRLVAHLDAVPQGFSHLDAFSRNAASVDGCLVLIDWALAGVAPIGADAAGIVAMTAMHGDVDRDRLGELYRSVVDGFVGELAAAGRAAEAASVEAAVPALLTLRWVGFLTQLHALGDQIVTIAESISGTPFDEVMASWTALSDLVLPLVDDVLQGA